MADLTHNNNVGKIPTTNVSIKGSGGDVDQTTDIGSLIGLRYLKDDELGTGSSTTTLADIDSVSLKNWFSQYVSTLGQFTKGASDDRNIKFSDYKGVTILGFKIQTINETYNRYQTNNNAGLKISPLNGSLGSYTVTAGSQQKTATAGEQIIMGRGDGRFQGNGGTISVTISDDTTGVAVSVTWRSAYVDGNSFLTASNTVSTLGKRFDFTWATPSTPRSTNYSTPLFLFLGEENTRAYGGSYES